MSADWYERFHAMRATFFAGTTQEVADARAFYESIVGAPAIVRLTAAMHLDLTEGGQDWAIEVADGHRVDEFLDHYERAPLDADERYWLLELILASFENRSDLLVADAPARDRLRTHVMAAFEEHRGNIRYWARLDEPDQQGWAITPLMREIWAACAGGAGA